MAPLAKLAAVAMMIASGVVAAPWDSTVRQSTHRVRSVGPQGTKLQTYHPEPVYETYGVDGVDHPLTKRGIKDASSVDAAKSFLESKLGVAADAVSHRTGSNSDVAEHQYFRQQFNGLPVANAVANVALKNNKVVSFGASFVKPKSVAAATPKLTKDQAIAKAEAATGAKYNSWPTSVEYFAKDSDHVVLTHVVQVQNDQTGEWYATYVDAATGEVVNIVSFVADASYHVVPLGKQDITQGYSTVSNPADTTASPSGWHTGTTTAGNNVISYKSSTSGVTSQSSATNNYEYVLNTAASPATSPNVDAARVNSFYIANVIHDITYKYGFDEASYNFQDSNGSKGGKGNDRVQISVQDSSGTNNANFATPPDGQHGQMRMFTWTYTSPNRDGALENDIVTHEYTHGISNRLTGGGTGSCLGTTEAGGMGEGWSDALADWMDQESAADASKDYTLGSYVVNKAAGIRTYPYSTSKSTNPLTYASLATRNEVHAIGELWALMWHEIYYSLVAKYGWTDKYDPNGTGGNVKALHLFIDGLKLQPCSPTFRSARDAIIQADANRFGGANKCLLWQAFAKRGLGTGATATRADSTAVPSGC
ncbi:extracellular metalloproteinase MEP [Ceratobasidium sp. AG-Ba]|nr:extracellular metalloproteinase MEP [Ceratobasidium sp. AG-Ba]